MHWSTFPIFELVPRNESARSTFHTHHLCMSYQRAHFQWECFFSACRKTISLFYCIEKVRSTVPFYSRNTNISSIFSLALHIPRFLYFSALKNWPYQHIIVQAKVPLKQYFASKRNLTIATHYMIYIVNRSERAYAKPLTHISFLLLFTFSSSTAH